jgi:hypothetical protein
MNAMQKEWKAFQSVLIVYGTQEQYRKAARGLLEAVRVSFSIIIL